MSKSYLHDLMERVGASVVGAALAALGASGVEDLLNVDWMHVDWKGVVTLALLAGAVSLAKGLLARGVGNPDEPSLLRRQ